MFNDIQFYAITDILQHIANIIYAPKCLKYNSKNKNSNPSKFAGNTDTHTKHLPTKYEPKSYMEEYIFQGIQLIFPEHAVFH